MDVERGVGPVAGDGLDVRDGEVGAGQDDRAGRSVGRDGTWTVRAGCPVRVEVRDLRLTHRAEDSRLCCPAPTL